MSRHFHVAVICCPSEQEKAWRVEGDSLHSPDGGERYSFQHVVQESGGGDELYSEAISPLVSSALEGGHQLYVVAYGLPGTGKTRAVFGQTGMTAGAKRDASGIVARLGRQIFHCVSGDSVCRVSASFFHVFEDGRVTDLFDSRRRRLELVQDSSGVEYTIPSLTSHPVCSTLELARLAERANLMRNASGGRRGQPGSLPTPLSPPHRSHCSHAFISLTVERLMMAAGEEERVVRSQITLVDLAGHSIALVQSGQPSPDTGVHTLQQILTSLPSQGIVATSPLFPNSSLTKLLKPCLGGNSEALLVGTLSLSESSRESSQRCLEVLRAAAEIKNYCRHSVSQVSESDLGKMLGEIRELKRGVCERVGAVQEPVSWEAAQDNSYVEINGKRYSELSSSCGSLLQKLEKLETQLLYKGVSSKKKQSGPVMMGSQPRATAGTSEKAPVPLVRPFLSKPAQLAKPVVAPVLTSSPQPSATHSSSSSLESSSSEDGMLSQQSSNLTGPPPPPLRDIPHIIPNSTFIPPPPPVRPSSAHSIQKSLASSSQVSSAVSEIHQLQTPSSPTGSSQTSLLRTAPSPSQLHTPHFSHLPRALMAPRAGLSLPVPVRPLASLQRPVLPQVVRPPRPLVPLSVVRPPTTGLLRPPLPLLSSTPKKEERLTASPGLPLSDLPPVPPSPTQPSTPGSLTPNAGSPAPTPSPSPSPLPRQPITPPSHLPPLNSSPITQLPEAPITGGNPSSSSPSLTLTDSDLSQEARDTFDPVMRTRALSMHRNSLTHSRPQQEEAPPYDGNNMGQRGEAVGGGERESMNMSEYTSQEEIHTAAMEGVKSSHIKKLAIQYGVDYRDHGGRTPLMYAVLSNQPRMCDILLGLGAKVNTQDATGLTPLLWATFQAKIQCMKTLLKHGADIHVRDSEGRSVFHWAVKIPNIHCLKALQRQASPVIINTADKEGLTPLHWAVLCNQPAHTHLLLTSTAADVGLTDPEGRTALTHAVLSSSAACIKAILDVRGEVVNHCDEKGRTALHYACAEGSTECVRTIISAQGCDLHSRDKKGTTPLHWAAAANQPSVLQLLLRRGVDRSLRDEDGLTAVEHAEVRGHSECARILHNYGLRRPSSALSVASQVSVHAPQPPTLDQHGHVALSLPHRRFSLSHSSLPRPPADGQAHPDDSLSDHTHRAESHTQQDGDSVRGAGVRGWREMLFCGCTRRRNAIMPAPDVT